MILQRTLPGSAPKHALLFTAFLMTKATKAPVAESKAKSAMDDIIMSLAHLPAVKKSAFFDTQSAVVMTCDNWIRPTSRGGAVATGSAPQDIPRLNPGYMVTCKCTNIQTNTNVFRCA